MRLDEGMDTGPLIAQRERKIGSQDTAESLTPELFALGSELLLANLASWVNGQLKARPQDGSMATVTSKLERSDGEADWRLTARELELRRRAHTPWPGLFTHWQGQVLKLLDVVALPALGRPAGEPGLVVGMEDTNVPVGIITEQGVLGLKSMQLEGRRAASAGEFIRGYPAFIGSQL